VIDRSNPLQPHGDLNALVEAFFRTSFSTDNPVITEAVQRMLAAGGKRLRPRFTLLAVEANGGAPRDYLPLAAYMELIHVAALIHDDVVDRAATRRGVNSTAVDYGNQVSILAGDYLFAWIFKNVTKDYPSPVPHILATAVADLTDGEVLQHRAVGNPALTFSEYLDIVIKKTSSLFAAAGECGAIMTGASPLRVKALRDFGHFFGIAFQMHDDMLDFVADESELGKPVGNDLRERKVTVPLILALANAAPDFQELVTRFYASGDGSDASREAVSALVAAVGEAGGLLKTRDAIAGYVERAKSALAPLGSVAARAELVALADTLARESASRAR